MLALLHTHQIGSKPLIYSNLGQQVKAAAEKYGPQSAVKSEYDAKELSFEDSYEEAVNLVGKLSEVGLEQGDHLAVWIPNTIQCMVNQAVYMGKALGIDAGTAAVFAHDGSESAESALNSVGKIFGHGEAKIVNEKGTIMKFGEVGELYIRGWFTMLNYFEDEENSRLTKDSKGWLRTGNLVLKGSGVPDTVWVKKFCIYAPQAEYKTTIKDIAKFCQEEKLLLNIVKLCNVATGKRGAVLQPKVLNHDTPSSVTSRAASNTPDESVAASDRNTPASKAESDAKDDSSSNGDRKEIEGAPTPKARCRSFSRVC
ncbi:Acyl-CoA synthetase family member 2, mitochondrial [Eumeta japonica]|uniref:Acyl-CoA synthetase family member 2, mitochondrial n=1 Tax=Eumeta variegata TaxID=151549 RepID=A0A4C1SRS5_EUMVA|nr:Acyl-CoA synthetase family member 2, mitochondrial [Eumeta japonica]